MKTYEEFALSRKNINTLVRVRNTISLALICYLGYLVVKTSSPYVSSPLMGISVFIFVVSAVICFSITVVKIRNVLESRRHTETLHDYIKEAIKEARSNDNYSVLNSLLDSKYSTHVILVMSKYPLSSFDFSRLAKWEKLESALRYFQDNNFKVEDLMNQEKMVDYLKSVYPEFLETLSNSK